MLFATGYERLIMWLQQHLLTCPSKQYLHIECPGCGLQRSIVLLLRGDVAASFSMYPAAVPMIWLFVFTCLHIRFHFSSGAVVIRYSAAVVALLISAFYIYKIINHKIIS